MASGLELSDGNPSINNKLSLKPINSDDDMSGSENIPLDRRVNPVAPFTTATVLIAEGSDERSCDRFWRKPNVQRYVISAIVCLVILVAIIYFMYNCFVSPGDRKPSDNRFIIQSNDQLVPPNPVYRLPSSPSMLRVFRNGAICSDSELCSQIGRDILQTHGNIVDATLATMFCNGMMTMQSMGIGGGFLLNIYIRNERKSYTLNAKEVAPIASADTDRYYSNVKDIESGPHSIATPGEILGYWELYNRFGGSIPWPDIIRPTIKICEDGFIISKHMSDTMPANLSTTSFRIDCTVRNTLITKSNFGCKIWPPKELCQTYHRIADEGGLTFYNGSLARDILADLNDLGSEIDTKDLSNYKTRWSESIMVPLGSKRLHITPPPTGGLIVGFILNILKGYYLNKSSETKPDEILEYHRIIEAFKFSFGKRGLIGDPEFNDMSMLISNMTSDGYANNIRNLIDDTRTFSDPTHYNDDGKFADKDDYGTAHISAVAANGDAISATSSINFYFGSNLIGPRTGIIFNNGMDDFSIPQISNFFGVPPSPLNFIKPFKRSVTSMAPAIVTDSFGDVRIVIGAAGGTKIPTSIAFNLIRMLWYDDDVKSAVDIPRIHHQLIPMEVNYEYGNLDSTVRGLEKLGHKMVRYRDRGSVICAIMKNSTGVFGNADYRKAGDVVGFD